MATSRSLERQLTSRDNRDLTWFSLSNNFGTFPGTGEESWPLDQIISMSLVPMHLVGGVRVTVYQTVGNLPQNGSVEVIPPIPEPSYFRAACIRQLADCATKTFGSLSFNKNSPPPAWRRGYSVVPN